MDDRVWMTVCMLLSTLPERSPRCVFSVREILKVGLWAILRDRPFYFACMDRAWPEHLRPAQLPTQSTLSRRWRHPAVRAALDQLHQRTLELLGPLSRTGAVDGRPLLVGRASQDKEAAAGRAVRGMGRGYKLHALVTGAGVVACFRVRPLNQAEQTVAKELLESAPARVSRVLGDKIFDSMPLHKVARATGRKLYTRLRENRVGRRQQRERLRNLRLLTRGVGRRFMRSRDEIERTFARMSNLGFGFKGLPPWSRRLHRVTAWISGKLLLFHAYLIDLKQQHAVPPDA
jgi:hypothetical protein